MIAFIKAVFAGTLAGAWLPLMFTMLMAVGTLPNGINGNGRLWTSVWFAISPIAVTFPIVLGACLFPGLPVALLLKHLNRETKANYIISGAITGFAVPVAVLAWMQAPDGWWLAILGSFSGGNAAASWSKSRCID